MSYNVIDIANKIIARTDVDSGDTISNLKLQKMLYYMQGFHLAFFGDPLFEDEIEAWQYGPVVPTAYNQFKSFGSGAIPVPENLEILGLNKEEENVFDVIYDLYGQYSALKLMNMTHEETPWKTTEINCIISKNILTKYFKTRIKK